MSFLLSPQRPHCLDLLLGIAVFYSHRLPGRASLPCLALMEAPSKLGRTLCLTSGAELLVLRPWEPTAFAPQSQLSFIEAPKSWAWPLQVFLGWIRGTDRAACVVRMTSVAPGPQVLRNKSSFQFCGCAQPHPFYSLPGARDTGMRLPDCYKVVKLPGLCFNVLPWAFVRVCQPPQVGV